MAHHCPTCTRSFGSRRGLAVHHASAHDEKSPNNVCQWCDSDFYSPHQKRYCSDECRRSVPRSGKHAPNYQGAKETATCEICASEFDYYPSEKKGLYCSTCVETENWRNTPDLSGEHNGKWNGGKLKLECETCGVPVHRYPSNVGEHGVFCGTECRSAWLSEHYTGENHPHWRGGSSGTSAYGPGWAKMRRRALERDAYTCQHCGTTKEELGRNPDVHHIIPVRAFVEMPVMMVEDAHYLENLVSLCILCHRKAEFGKISQKELKAACV